MNMQRFLWPLVIVLAVGALFLWGLRRSNPTALPSVLVGKPAPAFTLPVLPPYQAEWGRELELSELVGKKPILINFWASWCIPCQQEGPVLSAFWQQNKDKIMVLGINTQERNPSDALSFIQQYGLGFPSVQDNGRMYIEYGTYGVPETFLIDTSGKVRLRHVGPVSQADLAAMLKQGGG
ncbi:membrane protein [Meiothermus granaticius NBRC 107808]|uniref:Thiol:disulfide interchange protein CycY n=2 Tax=Meiothermus TaxID=65551 RepID=A0A399FAC2_9DEIN|nr:Thiol:disulfide interchange protein CycY [Meiothermus granaticius NBRC 107808]GEM85614.1 membrane protein [Meiothermus granaticius NBRC 107808]